MKYNCSILWSLTIVYYNFSKQPWIILCSSILLAVWNEYTDYIFERQLGQYFTQAAWSQWISLAWSSENFVASLKYKIYFKNTYDIIFLCIFTLCHTQTYFRTVESVWSPKYLFQNFETRSIKRATRLTKKCILSKSRYCSLWRRATTMVVIPFHSMYIYIYIYIYIYTALHAKNTILAHASLFLCHLLNGGTC